MNSYIEPLRENPFLRAIFMVLTAPTQWILVLLMMLPQIMYTLNEAFGSDS